MGREYDVLFGVPASAGVWSPGFSLRRVFVAVAFVAVVVVAAVVEVGVVAVRCHSEGHKERSKGSRAADPRNLAVDRKGAE
jgi:hypothetical protein